MKVNKDFNPNDEEKNVPKGRVSMSEMSRNYHPVQEEDLQLLTDVANQTISLLAFHTKQFQQGYGIETPYLIYVMYKHLHFSILEMMLRRKHFNAQLFVTLSYDFRKETKVLMDGLKMAIRDFQAQDIHLEDKLQNDKDWAWEESLESRFMTYEDMVLRLRELIEVVRNNLNALCEKYHCVEHGECCNRTPEEMLFLHDDQMAKHHDGEFQSIWDGEEASYNQLVSSTGMSRHDVLVDAYKTETNALKGSKLGRIYFTKGKNSQDMAVEMGKEGINRQELNDYYRSRNMLDRISDGITMASREEELERCLQDNQEKTPAVCFVSREKEKLVEKHWALVVDYMTGIKAKPMEWVCLYHTLLLYKYIKPVDFLVFRKWLNNKLGMTVITSNRASQLQKTYWVEIAAASWFMKDALGYLNTENTVTKFHLYTRIVDDIHTILQCGKLN